MWKLYVYSLKSKPQSKKWFIHLPSKILLHWIYEVMETLEMTHVFPFHLLSVKCLGTASPLLSLGSPRDERWRRRTRTSGPNSELFLKLPFLSLVKCYLKNCLCSTSKGEPRLSSKAEEPGYVLHIISLSYPGLSHRVCACEVRYLLVDWASTVWLAPCLVLVVCFFSEHPEPTYLSSFLPVLSSFLSPSLPPFLLSFHIWRITSIFSHTGSIF